MTLEHLADIRRKIADLKRLARILENMVAQCDGGTMPDCPIVDVLLEDAGAWRHVLPTNTPRQRRWRAPDR